MNITNLSSFVCFALHTYARKAAIRGQAKIISPAVSCTILQELVSEAFFENKKQILIINININMTDFAAMRVWSDEDATSINPICLEDIKEEDLVGVAAQKKEKKKRRRRRKKLSEGDSSVADSMLSSILSESEQVVPQTNYHEKRELERKNRREKLEKLKMRRTSPKKQVKSNNKNKNKSDDLSNNPFADDDLSQNPFSDQIADDDLSKNPFTSNNNAGANISSGINPFGDDSIRDRVISDSEESSTICPPPLSMYLEENKDTKATNPFEEDEESFDDDEDIIESSKRLLRCVDQRIQYQQQNDEVRSLKAQLKRMKSQAEAMAEQLRRAVETKCDLVLAQNEMERNHEQGQIAKEAELKDLRKYIQEILEQQAKSELNFMNEIASLARTLEMDKKKHAQEIERKKSNILQLQSRIESMRVSSVREISSESFHKRFGKDFVNPSYE